MSYKRALSRKGPNTAWTVIRQFYSDERNCFNNSCFINIVITILLLTAYDKHLIGMRRPCTYFRGKLFV